MVAAVLADPGPTWDARRRAHEQWERELKKVGLPEYLTRHRVTMAELNRAGRNGRTAAAWSE